MTFQAILPPRRYRRAVARAVLLAACVLAGPVDAAPDAAPAGTAPDSLAWSPPPRHFGRAAAEVLGTNLLVWSYDRYVREGGELAEFRVGTNSIWDNIKNGFEWDNNDFGTNNFSHPYHGSLYYNAARSNGFSFWESVPFTFAGSYLWEYTGERNNPAYNDWINTSVGGVVLGESLHRLSDLVLDDTATGAGRFWREVGGLLICPMRGFNRILSGEWSHVGLNAPDRRPDRLGFRLETGVRSQSRQKIANEDTSGAYVAFEFLYGDPFSDEDIRPFDAFSFAAQLNFNDVATVGRVQVESLLGGRKSHPSAGTWHIVGGYQDFEYVNNRGFEFGGQSVGAMWLSRRGGPGASLALVTDVGLGVLLLAGTSSEVANFSGRDYDYGTGLSYRAGARLFRRGRVVAELRSEGNWLSVLNGLAGDHFIAINHLKGELTLVGGLGVGVEARAYYRKAWYDAFADVTRWLPEGRAYVTLARY